MILGFGLFNGGICGLFVCLVESGGSGGLEVGWKCHNCAGSLHLFWGNVLRSFMHGSNLALVRCCEGIEALSGKV